MGHVLSLSTAENSPWECFTAAPNFYVPLIFFPISYYLLSARNEAKLFAGGISSYPYDDAMRWIPTFLPLCGCRNRLRRWITWPRSPSCKRQGQAGAAGPSDARALVLKHFFFLFCLLKKKKYKTFSLERILDLHIRKSSRVPEYPWPRLTHVNIPHNHSIIIKSSKLTLVQYYEPNGRPNLNVTRFSTKALFSVLAFSPGSHIAFSVF